MEIREKNIKIYLSSNLDEVKDDRNELEGFIGRISRNLRERYKGRGVIFDIVPLHCEDYNPEINGNVNSDEFVELIAGCDICVFLVFTDADKATVDEFNLAREVFESSENGKPKIYTYFKQLSGAEIKQSVFDFMDELDKSFSHFWNTFENIDTVKLNLILNLSILNEGFIQVEFEEGECLINGEEKLDLSRVSQFANNRELRSLKLQMEEVEKEYLALRPKYASGKATEEENRRYAKIAAKRQSLIDIIDELEEGIFALSYKMCRDETKGELTLRQREAYRLFEHGDFEGAISILEFTDINSEFERDEKKMIKKATVLIREHKTAIEILSAMKLYEGRFAEIKKRYDYIVPIAEKYLVELDIVYDYAYYLYAQGDASAYEIALGLKEIYINHRDICNDYKIAKLYELIGIICLKISAEPEECEMYFIQAIDILNKLNVEGEKNNNSGLASLYINIGAFYIYQNCEEAEEYYKKAIEIYKKLAKDSRNYKDALAVCYINIGFFNASRGESKAAEQNYLNAIELYEELVKTDKDNYSENLGIAYNNIGLFYSENEVFEKAEACYVKAIQIFKEIVLDNPDRYYPNLSRCYNNIGLCCYNQGKLNIAEDYYIKAIRIRERLVEMNPMIYKADLSESYNNAGLLYDDKNDNLKAEFYFEKAIEILEELSKTNPDRYCDSLAISYNNFSGYFRRINNPEKVIEYSLKAIEILEDLANKKPKRYNQDLAISYWNYAEFLQDRKLFYRAYLVAKTAMHNPVCRQIVEMYEKYF